MELGELIKLNRKKMKMTQKELSNGICTQALISRVEHGDIIPNQSILNKIGARLNLSSDDLQLVKSNTRYREKIEQLKQTIRKYLTQRDYKTIELILHHNKPLVDNVQNANDKAFLRWIEASLQDKIYNQSDIALDLLNEISLNDIEDELVIEILNAIGVIYYRNGDFNRAINVFQNAVNVIDEQIDFKVQVKVMLNYALSLEEIDGDKKALEVILHSINIVVENESLFILGDLYHTKAHILRKLGHLLEAKKNNQIALSLYMIQNNDEFQTMTQIEIKELSEEMEEIPSFDYMS